MGHDPAERQHAEQARDEDEGRLRAAFDSAPEGMLLLDTDCRPLRVNRSYCEILGYTEAELLAMPFRSVTHPDDLAAQGDNLARLFAGEVRTCTFEQRFLRKYGQAVWGLVSVSLVRSPQGTAPAFLVVHVRDITAQQRAGEQIVRREARYHGIVDALTSFVARADPAEGRFTFVNEAYRRLIGKPFEELIGRPFLDIVYPDDVADVLAVFRQTIESPRSRIQFDCRVVTPDGPAWVSWDGAAIVDGCGVIKEIQAVGHDVTGRKAAESALRSSLERLQHSEEKLRSLARHQTAIREEERRRLGFDLHDEVCQEIVGCAIMLESLKQRLQPLPAREAVEIDRIVRHLSAVVEHLRLVARDLQPMLLSSLGLEGALRVLAEGLSSDATSVRAECRRPIPRLDGEIELGVYRIAQEALTNACRHAGARAIVLTLDAADHTLHLEVRDDGQGFVMRDGPASRAFGLLSMEERATALGGHLDIRSEPGKGTAVRLQCPLDVRAPVVS